MLHLRAAMLMRFLSMLRPLLAFLLRWDFFYRRDIWRAATSAPFLSFGSALFHLFFGLFDADRF